MKDLVKYIQESADEQIFEGRLLDKLKDAIEKVIDNPQKYFDAAKEQMQELKDKKDYHYLRKTNIDTEKGQEMIAKELDNLNNDNDLKAIYRYVKTVLNDESSGYDNRKSGLTGNDNCGVEKLFKDIQKEFNCSPAKAFAIMQIANAMFIAKKEAHPDKFSAKSYSPYSSRSSRSNSAKIAGITASVTAAMIARRR